jgi:hypothetical protein
MSLARRSYLKFRRVDDSLESVGDVAIEVAELHANFVSALSFQN